LPVDISAAILQLILVVYLLSILASTFIIWHNRCIYFLPLYGLRHSVYSTNHTVW
jgi:hypothetical protein